ncbi:MAG: hypothetical protein ACP5RK_03135 [Candidatus Micrarchaeia archaeon]
MVIQKTLDEYGKSKEEALAAVRSLVYDYLNLSAKQKALEEEVFSRLYKSGIIKENEKKTIPIEFKGKMAYIEQFESSITSLVKASNMKITDSKSYSAFREALRNANSIIEEIPSLPTRLYFRAITKGAKIGDENAKNVIGTLYDLNLIEFKFVENIDTRNIDFSTLIDKAKKERKIIQENLDMYIDRDYTISYVSRLIQNSYFSIYKKLDQVKDQIFLIINEFKLINEFNLGTIKISTDYGNVYIGVYEDIEYKKEDEERIKKILKDAGFGVEIEVPDMQKLNRDKYRKMKAELENRGYIEGKEVVKRIVIREKEELSNLKRD